jgi:hypothetical protein
VTSRGVGQGFLGLKDRTPPATKEISLSHATRYARQHAKARPRRRRNAQERLARDRRQAQQAAEALHHALEPLGLPDTVVREIAGRLRSQQKRLGKIVGVMFPALCGCRTPAEWCRVRGWDQHGPARRLHAVPKRSWRKRRRRLGLEGLVPLWRPGATQSAATPRRWQWTWATEDAVCHTDGAQWRCVGPWGSGQPPRGLSGIDGLWLVVSMGEGTWVVPVACAMRRPDPIGAGAPCRDTRTWARAMSEERLAALRHRGLERPPPLMTAERGLSDAPCMTHIRQQPQGPFLVEGKVTAPFALADGRHVHGHDCLAGEWPWRDPPWEPRGRDGRLQAQRPTDGAVTVVMVDEPGPDRVSRWCLETTLSGPVLMRRWRRRNGIALVLRVLKHLWATESCQGHSEEASSGHLG